jgi:hypothetical protein
MFDLFPMAGAARGGGIDPKSEARCRLADAVIKNAFAMGLRFIRVASASSYKYW